MADFDMNSRTEVPAEDTPMDRRTVCVICESSLKKNRRIGFCPSLLRTRRPKVKFSDLKRLGRSNRSANKKTAPQIERDPKTAAHVQVDTYISSPPQAGMRTEIQSPRVQSPFHEWNRGCSLGNCTLKDSCSSCTLGDIHSGTQTHDDGCSHQELSKRDCTHGDDHSSCTPQNNGCNHGDSIKSCSHRYKYGSCTHRHNYKRCARRQGCKCYKRRRNYNLNATNDSEEEPSAGCCLRYFPLQRCKGYMKILCHWMMSSVGMCCIVIAYCLLGASIFLKLEGPAEDEAIAAFQRAIDRSKQMFGRFLMALPVGYAPNVTFYMMTLRNIWMEEIGSHLDYVTGDFGKAIENEYYDPEQFKRWTYAGSLLFSVSVVTTMGFGNIVPVTDTGRIVYMLYALIGIPITLVCIRKLGDMLARLFQASYYHMLGRTNTDSVRVPLLALLGVVIGYLAMGAALFDQWEKWSFLESFYFCFTALSTIGFGDIVPGFDTEPFKTDRRIVCILYMFLGLALVAMCFELLTMEVDEKFHTFGTYLGKVGARTFRDKPKRRTSSSFGRRRHTMQDRQNAQEGGFHFPGEDSVDADDEDDDFDDSDDDYFDDLQNEPLESSVDFGSSKSSMYPGTSRSDKEIYALRIEESPKKGAVESKSDTGPLRENAQVRK